MRRLEASERGQLLISAFIVVVLVCLVATTLPLFGVRRALTKPVEPVLDLTALHQSWGMFAPNPRTYQLSLSVVLHYPDGGTWRWSVPSGGPWVSPARDYRWRKWIESAGADLDATGPDAARYAASRAPRSGATSADVIVHRAMLPGVPSRGGADWRDERRSYELGGLS